MTAPTRLLVISQYWTPAHLAGGARNTETALRSLGDDVRAWVLAGDRDVGDREAWPTADGRWIGQGSWQVSHGPWGRHSLARVRAAARLIDPDVIYLPSLFAPGSLAAFALGLHRRRRVVVGPEGELEAGALQQSSGRKRVVMAGLRATGVLRTVAWRATDDDEARIITELVGGHPQVVVAPTLPGPPSEALPRPAKVLGRARLIHLATLTPKKGLRRALEALADVEGEVELTIAGPIADQREADACRVLANALPANVSIEWRGPVPVADVPALLAAHDAMVLPTRGENFGYVVLEALDQGCPVLISDRTPWTSLDADGAGWVVPLDDLEAWRDAVDAVVQAGPEAARQWATDARAAATKARDGVDVAAWRAVLLRP